ncbi:hypothetical protein [Bradyrhizobium erythrophlei]|jgi:hypothetical protein|uniref:Uncharacterized protein n=1 Tax=Bradyrhizobium erythrophlei TaxID=1437360 RepID=A0A1M5PVB4_9BRAD|nr:hypothetical protein [Bradyrhizobium erythrophlei]SHH05795.1 hypothetical protein SAMN05443248_3529 [Bradyrhizobium erythrophlei]
MTDLPKRRRGRPTKEEAAAREAAAKAVAEKEAEEGAFLDELLSRPIGLRRTKLQPDEDTLRALAEIARLFGTQEEAAAILGVSPRTISNFFNDYPETREVWEDGLMHAKVSLRRKQLALADKNAPAAIFLGKNYLAQKDENHTNLNVRKEATEMSEAELLELASRAKKPAKQDDEKKQSVH